MVISYLYMSMGKCDKQVNYTGDRATVKSGAS